MFIFQDVIEPYSFFLKKKLGNLIDFNKIRLKFLEQIRTVITPYRTNMPYHWFLIQSPQVGLEFLNPGKKITRVDPGMDPAMFEVVVNMFNIYQV